MVQADILDEHGHWATHPLVRAFAISLTIHLLLFCTLEVGNRLDLWRLSPFAILARMLHVDSPLFQSPAERLKQAQARKAAEEEAAMPLVFVDVDPSQATTEAPPKTKYYSAVNSLAGNPDTSRDTPTPKLDGQQDKVLKTMDTQKANTMPFPLQPNPAPKSAETAQSQSAQPAQASKAKPADAAPPKRAEAAPQPKPVASPGDTAMATPNLRDRIEPQQLASAAPAASGAETEHVRPRTVAEAKRRMNDRSALVGERVKQEGGSRRFSVSSSLDVSASIFGSYDAQFIAAVQYCWYGLLEEQRYSLDRLGKVTIDFRLMYDGRIENLTVESSDVGEIYTTLCRLAITNPSPFERWPSDMRRIIGANYRDVRFTFYY